MKSVVVQCETESEETRLDENGDGHTQGDIALIQEKWPNIQPIPTPAFDFYVENDEKFSTDVAPGQAGLGDSAGDELDGGTKGSLPAPPKDFVTLVHLVVRLGRKITKPT
jgi:hypothetical protein